MLEITSVSKGAELTSIKLNSIEKLHDAKCFWNRHAPILFPIVGKLKNDKTRIGSKTYEMTQHGFARDIEFKKIDNHSYLLTSDDETKKKFPYDFELYISYEILNNTLVTNCKIVNKSNSTMPFGIGFHPAFKCDYSLGNYYLEFENSEDNLKVMQLIDGYLSNIEINPNNYILKNKMALHSSIFDNDAIILTNLTSNKVILRNNENISLIFDFTEFPFLGIWSKKDAPFVCIEPWFSTADRTDSDGIFENKDAILKLNSNQIFECSFSVEFK